VKTVKFVKTMKRERKDIDQRLFKSEDGLYYISSAVKLPDIIGGRSETMVFQSDPVGTIENYTDLGHVNFVDHYWALRAAGLDWKDFLK
jgi:hypothetical protein